MMQGRRVSRRGRSAMLLALLACAPVQAAGPVSLGPTQSDYGGVGLLQNPSARFADEGELSIGVSSFDPYANLYVSLQLLDWLETTLRYTRVDNRDYGPAGFGDDQTRKDRGFDFKLRLLEEQGLWPALALGVRDIGGTGLFGSEYLVASKAWQNFDFSLGLGWGRLGARGDFSNPLAELSDSFEERDEPDEGGGSPDFSRWFRGDEVAVFGGVEWRTGWRGLRVKLEFEGNDYDSEPLGNDQDQDSPFNLALFYPLSPAFDLAVGIERGNTLMVNLNTHVNFQRERGPAKFFDPAPQPIQSRPAVGAGGDWPARQAAFTAALEKGLQDGGFRLHAVDVNRGARAVQVWYSQPLFRNHTRAAGRVARVLTGTAPAEIETFVLINVEGAVETHRITVLRSDLERARSYTADAGDVWAGASVTAPRSGYRDAAYTDRDAYPEFSWEMGPALRQHVGGPEGFYFGQLWWKVGGRLQLTPELDLSGTLGFDIYNNFDGLESRPSPTLPPVRSDIVRYLQEGENNLAQLEANYIWSPASSWYARLSAGIFEEMYGGVAGEVLYRPFGRDWAVGLDLNRVRQRDFDQRFSFRDYEVTTGHLTLYQQLPWYDILAQVSVGRYLAGDEGGTIDLSREFANGVRAGAFATFTNVSAEDFGEGRFDKGFYLSLPLDLFFTNSTRRRSNLVFKPLTKDGGQKVRDGRSLYSVTGDTDFDAIARGWPQFLD